MTNIAALGHLTLDVVADAAPRPGGGVFYAARALSRLGADARIAASCAARDRPALLPPLEAFGLPVTWHESTVTTAYSFHYEGDRRIMRQDAVGDPWTPAQAVSAAGDAEWVDVGALVRTDFSPETLAALAAGGRRLLVDAQGLVRTATIGRLDTDGDIGDALEHIEILKLNDEEAETLVGQRGPGGAPRARSSRDRVDPGRARVVGHYARSHRACGCRRGRWPSGSNRRGRHVLRRVSHA